MLIVEGEPVGATGSSPVGERKIRRPHLTSGKGIKTICRDLMLSKQVLRKVIRTGIAAFPSTRTVRRHASNRARDQGSGASSAFGPPSFAPSFAPGEACQIDRSHLFPMPGASMTICATAEKRRR